MNNLKSLWRAYQEIRKKNETIRTLIDHRGPLREKLLGQDVDVSTNFLENYEKLTKKSKKL